MKNHERWVEFEDGIIINGIPFTLTGEGVGVVNEGLPENAVVVGNDNVFIKKQSEQGGWLYFKQDSSTYTSDYSGGYKRNSLWEVIDSNKGYLCGLSEPEEAGKKTYQTIRTPYRYKSITFDNKSSSKYKNTNKYLNGLYWHDTNFFVDVVGRLSFVFHLPVNYVGDVSFVGLCSETGEPRVDAPVNRSFTIGLYQSAGANAWKFHARGFINEQLTNFNALTSDAPYCFEIITSSNELFVSIKNLDTSEVEIVKLNDAIYDEFATNNIPLNIQCFRIGTGGIAISRIVLQTEY